ncbi:MAG: GIY-YIG nuclease family protein [Candidatus Pacebacteria bacterium]|nr:GIY-YIG nuclease family protein [Candidatus Paceibacterota bacterium]
MHYVYILFSQKLKKRYIGKTSDLKIRIKQHNSGKSNFSSKGMPWKLVYYEAFLTKDDATREELFLKTGKGRERIKYLFGEVA